MIKFFMIFFIILKINHVSCQTDKTRELTKYIDSTVVYQNDIKLFLVGENHYLNGNVDIVFDVFKTLYYEQGVRVFVFERGVSEIYLMNRLINLNDSSVLSLFVDKYFRKLYDKLYNFNQTLDKNNKIVLVGIDVESYNPYSYLSIYKLLKEQSNKSEEMNEIYLDYKKKFVLNSDRIDTTIKIIHEKIKSDTAKYKFVMGEKAFYTLCKVIESFFYKSTKLDLNNINNKELIPFREKREVFMYNNFIGYYNLNKDSKYFGYFGNLHISLSKDVWIKQENWESIAFKLNNTVLKNKVTTYNMIYKYSSIIFSKFNKTHSYYFFNKDYLSKNNLESIKNDYFNKKCDYLILNSVNYSNAKNVSYIILNNYKQ